MFLLYFLSFLFQSFQNNKIHLFLNNFLNLPFHLLIFKERVVFSNLFNLLLQFQDYFLHFSFSFQETILLTQNPLVIFVFLLRYLNTFLNFSRNSCLFMQPSEHVHVIIPLTESIF